MGSFLSKDRYLRHLLAATNVLFAGGGGLVTFGSLRYNAALLQTGQLKT